ncbi:hypothetical protein ILUMI_15814 [Ignelater luminosus]|uniref:THAP-type domain-containing protein n=1 Tax=Ignelater luminosus TaxID=2038154 RepID=A0A8K0CPR0_IGNLU|nr:hypothetical protein ILUMI_15814 [Ignelater luminosus]
MPGCASVGCSNSSTKGFVMKRLPRDSERRKQWLVKMKRDKWKPTDNTYLCEVHFASAMWQKTRVDGTRKLKSNTVPTIFSFSSLEGKKRKAPTGRAPIPKLVLPVGQL